MMKRLAEMNTLAAEAALAHLAEVFEHSPWIMQSVVALRPWSSVEHLARLAADVIFHADAANQMALLRAHPDLAAKLDELERLTEFSQQEQRSADFNTLPAETLRQLRQRLSEYRERFGHPYILCLRDYDTAEVLPNLTHRLTNDPIFERAECLRQVVRIGTHRLHSLIDDRSPTAQPGITTHVLDTALGVPAAGVSWRCEYLEESGWRLLSEGLTGASGRAEPHVLPEVSRAGRYRLVFAVGAYFIKKEMTSGAFLDEVALEFGLMPGEHYHLPLLVSPWSYATYRGS